MPKKAKELSPKQVARLKKPGLHAVGSVAGLHLQVKESGGDSEDPRIRRSWILRIMVGDKRRNIGLGGYPDVPLKDAREAARRAREQVRQGIDPVLVRREARDALKSANAKRLTFAEAATACWKKKAREFKNPKHAGQWISTIEEYANPVIGSLPVDQVELAHVVRILEPIWTSRTETASRVRGRIESVLAWATVSGYRTGDNPARWKGNLDHVLPKPNKIKKRKHHAALPWQEVPAFMVELRKRDGISARALEFAIFTAARSGEVRFATWDEIDFGEKVWIIPADRMKSGKEHRVPLSAPAIALLNALPRFKDCELIFPSNRCRPLSDNALSSILKRMGVVGATPHGMRSSFKDWARTSTAYPDEVSELALAHVSSDETRAAYARDALLQKRTRLMRDWAKFLSRPSAVASVTEIKAHG